MLLLLLRRCLPTAELPDEHLVDATGRQIVVAVPPAVAVGPVKAPIVGAGAVAELGDAHLGPFGQVGVPRGTAVDDGDRTARTVEDLEEDGGRPEEAEIEATLAAHQEWALAGRPARCRMKTR